MIVAGCARSHADRLTSYRLPPRRILFNEAAHEHATLILGRNVKLGEDDDEHEDVVDRERLIEQLRRDIFRRGVSTVRRSDQQPHRQPQSYPHNHPRHVAG